MLIHRVKNARDDWVLDLGICVLPWSRAGELENHYSSRKRESEDLQRHVHEVS